MSSMARPSTGLPRCFAMSLAEQAAGEEIASSVIVGGGPGGLGPLLWAAQNGLLEEWLSYGVILVERTGRLGGRLGQYGINADSLGGTCLEFLESEQLPAALVPLRRDPLTLDMRRYCDDFPPLPLVDRFIAKVGRSLAAMFAAQPASSLLLGVEAQSIRLRRDGTLAVQARHDDGCSRILLARSAVIALGGRQFWRDQPLAPGLSIADCRVRHVLPSNTLLTHAGLADANEILRRAGTQRIVLLGGSHSAYAAAWALLELPAARHLGNGQLVILQRRPPRVFYPNAAAAVGDDYPFTPGDICPRTQRVNRMGGLRGHGRDMWRRIARRPDVAAESRVTVVDFRDCSASALRAEIEAAALVVPCLGYRSATLPIYDSAGHRIALKADRNADAVGQDCRVLLADGRRLPNVFAIGLGTGFRPTPSMGCEPNFNGQANSLWLYQNDIGGLICSAILAIQAAASPALPRAKRANPVERPLQAELTTLPTL
jgi:hypothetical protein